MNFDFLLKTSLCSLILINVVNVTLGQVTALKPLSVHILDATFGGNAPNVTCKLYRFSTSVAPEHHHNHDGFHFVAKNVTDADGRITQLLSAEDYEPGIYRIWFAIGDYYKYAHGVSTFFPETQIIYTNDGTVTHIPLVVNPFSVSTYKGS